jgi:hypothetical protein
MSLLRDVLHLDGWTALQNNLAVALLTILYYKALQELVIRTILPQKQAGVVNLNSKYCLHILLSSTIAFWPLYDTTDWSWRFNTLLPAGLFVRYLYKVREN